MSVHLSNLTLNNKNQGGVEVKDGYGEVIIGVIGGIAVLFCLYSSVLQLVMIKGTKRVIQMPLTTSGYVNLQSTNWCRQLRSGWR